MIIAMRLPRRFSLYTLLVVVSVVAVALGRSSTRARLQDVAIEAIRRVNGSVEYEDTWLVAPILKAIGHSRFRRIAQVSIGEATDEKVMQLMPHLLRLSGLKEFYLSHSLSMGTRPLTGNALACATRLRSLRSLAIWNAAISDSDLKCLESLGMLESLDIALSDITDDGVRHLLHCPHLSRLSLSRTKITDAGVESLIGLGELEYLDLSFTSISGEVLRQLPSMRSIREVNLRGTLVTPESVNRFMSEHPSIRILL
jgi:hypothetical protein